VIAGTFNVEKERGGSFQIENFKNSKILIMSMIGGSS